ncbi:unnamed protein product [Lampetra planeri]
MAVYKTRKKTLQGDTYGCSALLLPVIRGLLETRLRLEQAAYYSRAGDLHCVFFERWGAGKAPSLYRRERHPPCHLVTCSVVGRGVRDDLHHHHMTCLCCAWRVQRHPGDFVSC